MHLPGEGQGPLQSFPHAPPDQNATLPNGKHMLTPVADDRLGYVSLIPAALGLSLTA